MGHIERLFRGPIGDWTFFGRRLRPIGGRGAVAEVIREASLHTMKIRCHCGMLIVDNTDGLPHKAHLIPDQEWFGVFDAIDAVIADVAAGRSDVDSAQTRFRNIIGSASRPMYQCWQCGGLFVLDLQKTLYSFAPSEAETVREIFRSRDGHI